MPVSKPAPSVKGPGKAPDFAALAADRRALARAITLLESARPEDRVAAEALLHAAQARLAEKAATGARPALRLGLTGAPGAGKSTFIEAFGLYLLTQGLRLAVLAIDPSSPQTGGAILGDKTRMERLSRAPGAFIRPSPSQSRLGGIAPRTRDVALLCEAVGFDVILIETVGVGQSESEVADLADMTLLLIAPGGGDDLQGVKRGLMERADLLLITKGDGDLLPAARRSLSSYGQALALRAHQGPLPGFPQALLVSAEAGQGLDTVAAALLAFQDGALQSGLWAARRAAQAGLWLGELLRAEFAAQLASPGARAALLPLAQGLQTGQLSPHEAARAFWQAGLSARLWLDAGGESA